MNVNQPGLFIFFSAILSFYLALFAWRHRHDRAALWLSYLMVSIGIWSASYSIQLSLKNPAYIEIFSILSHVGITTLAPLWLLFVWHYTGYVHRFGKPYKLALFIVPAFALAMRLTNDLHLLYFSAKQYQEAYGLTLMLPEYGPIFWLHTTYAYIIMFAGFIMLVRMYMRVSKIYRPNLTYILAGASLPYFVNIAFVAGFMPYGYIDPTPFAFIFMGLLIAVGVFSTRLFGIVPLALDTLFNSISDAIFVFDKNNKLVNANSAAFKLLHRQFNHTDAINTLEINNSWAERILMENTPGNEIAIEGRTYLKTTNLITESPSASTGKVLILRDITEQKKVSDDLRQSEKMLKLIINNIPQYIFWKDRDGVIQGCNQIGAEVAGVDSPGEIIGKTDYELAWKKEEADFFRETDEEVMRSGKAQYHIIEPQQHANGKQAWLDTNKIPLHDEEGNVAGILVTFEDITEQLETREKLKESEEKYRTLFEQASDAIFIIDVASARITEHNKKASELTGYSSEQLRRKEIRDITGLHKDEFLAEITLHKTVDFGEVTFFRKDGSRRIALLSASLINKNQAVAFIKDITEIQQAQSELIEERNLFSDGPVCTFEWGPEPGRPVRRVSENILQITGYHPSEVTHPGFLFESIMHPDDFIKTLQETQQHMDSNIDVYEQSYRIKLKNGKYRWFFEFTKVDRDSNGLVTGIRGYLYDQHQSKKAEEQLKNSQEQFRLLLENVFDGIYLIENEKFEYVNKPFCDILEYSYEEITNEHFKLWDHLTPGSRKIMANRFEARIKREEVSAIYELQIISKSGTIKDVEITATETTRDDIPVTLGIIRDITDAKKARSLEQEVIIARKEARFKHNFLATMSHEIRTPLTGIMGMAEMLSRTSLNIKQSDFVSTIIESGENLRNIINLILDYSKLEAGQMMVNNTNFEFRRFMENTRNLFQVLCRKNVRLTIHADDDIPEFIYADRSKLTQILSNLLSNAIKFTSKGSVEVTASICPNPEQTDPDDLTIAIEVKDTGIGIEKAYMQDLFKPFFQIETHQVRANGGTGLGLSICRQLTELLQGTLTVESTPGQGSTFRFTFRARRAENTDEPRKVSANGKKRNYGEKNFNILVVEDLAINRKVLEIMLGFLGHNITFAYNGKHALTVFKPGLFDLILMDIQMPLMDGITAMQKLREKYTNLPPIVGLSANAFEGDREKYISLGMDEYLTKPVKSEEFAEVISRLIHQGSRH